jgi:hypothetical protein
MSLVQRSSVREMLLSNGDIDAETRSYLLHEIEQLTTETEPAAWKWRYVGETEWNTPSGGHKISPEELKRERPIEQRPLYALASEQDV